MVAYHRKYRYRKFQRTRKAGDKMEEPSVGMTGVYWWGLCLMGHRGLINVLFPGLGSAACEWQGHRRPLLPVSVEVSEDRRVRVRDRQGSVLRCFGLGGQDRLDVVVSGNRRRRAALLKGPKEYDLVRRLNRSGRGTWMLKSYRRYAPGRLLPSPSRCCFLTTRPGVRSLSRVFAGFRPPSA